MSREHVNILRSEIKSETATDQATYEVYRKKIIRTFMDTVEGDKRHDYDSRLIREFNNRCDQIGFGDGVKITPLNAGFTYTGQETGAPTGIFIPPQHTGNRYKSPDFTGYGGIESQPNFYQDLITNYNGENIGFAGPISYSQIQGPLYFHSPMFLSTDSYQSLINAQLMSKESYNLLDDGQVIGYGDEGGNSVSLAQERVLKLFGIGNTIIDFNTEFGRLLVDGSPAVTPMTCVGNTVGAPNTNEFSTGHWTKYEICQHFSSQPGASRNVPDSATGVVFGGFVKVPANDSLRELNFGGFSIRQNSNNQDFVDIVQVKGSDFNQSASMLGQDGSYANIGGNNGIFNWGNGRGLTISNAGTSSQKISESLPGGGSKSRLHQSKLQSECREWTQISGSFNLVVGSSRKLNFNIFYCENISYLSGDGVNAGSIHFSQPFLIFK